MKFMNLKKLVPAALIPCLMWTAGCGNSGPEDNTVAPSTRREVRGREHKLDAGKVAELNAQLAVKVASGTKDEVDTLLYDGATADAMNRHGLPVIFIAAQRGDVEILELLIKAGADVNAKIGTSHNTDGVGYTGTADGTPLAYAAGAGKVDAMDVLRKAGADLNAAGPEGTTPLMRAAEGGQLDSVQWLIINGSTAGREKALTKAQMVINPQDNYLQIIRLLSR